LNVARHAQEMDITTPRLAVFRAASGRRKSVYRAFLFDDEPANQGAAGRQFPRKGS
jgi:hypothetical protein